MTRWLLRPAGVLVLALALLMTAGLALSSPPEERPDSRADTVVVDATQTSPGADLSATISGLQDRLRRLPEDWQALAALGTAYVQQAAVVGDPTFYARAETALAESLQRRPQGNDVALTGQASLAAARHDFVAARDLADQALALNAYSAAAYGVKTDALIELGSYEQAFTSLQRMLDLRPAVPSYTRASYSFELRGDDEGARGALEQALRLAVDPGDAAFAHRYLAQLAFNAGDLAIAQRHVDLGLRRAPDSPALLAGRARVQAARGDVEDAIASYTSSVRRLPDPAVLTELGELHEALGQDKQAQEQYAVVRATQKLLAQAGVDLDLDQTLFLADHGDSAEAVRAASRGWETQKSVQAADAYAWALHTDGEHARALELSRESQRLGTQSALFAYHRGMIERALGDTEAARGSLEEAMMINPYFSPLHAPRARAALEELGAAE